MWTSLIGAIVGLVGSGIKYDRLDTAQDEARQLNDQQLRLNAQQDRFNNQLLTKQQDLQEDRFQLKSATTGYTMANDSIKRLENLLNTNVGLQDIVFKKWGA